MARRKKKRTTEGEARPAAPAGEARTSLRGLLKDVVLAPPEPEPAAKPKEAKRRAPAPPPKSEAAPPSGARPSETLRGEDRIAYYDAYAGVKPLADRPQPANAPKLPPATPPARSLGDEEARARLAALVAGGVRFDVERDGDELRAARAGTSPQIVRALLREDARAEASLDLHGLRAEVAEREVVRFVRAEQRAGARRVRIVHGKGLHSPGGAGVLREVVVRALTEGGAAPCVRAFVTASHAAGGSGALLVELMPR